MKYQFSPKELVQGLSSEEMGLTFTTVKRLEITKNQSIKVQSGEEELCLFVITGKVNFELGSKRDCIEFLDSIYLPRRSEIMLESIEKAVIMQFGAPVDIDTNFALIKHSNVSQSTELSKVFGSKEINSYRNVYNYIDDKFNASRLMVGVGIGQTGGWTVWPPHEHTEKREEVYCYFGMGDGFGIQCIYEDLKTPLYLGIVKDGDLISVPRGYHPNVGCPASPINYIYVMCAKNPGERNFMDLSIQKEFGTELK